METKYLIKQEMFNKQHNKLIAIRYTKDDASNLVDYLQDVDPKNTYYYHSYTEI